MRIVGRDDGRLDVPAAAVVAVAAGDDLGLLRSSGEIELACDVSVGTGVGRQAPSKVKVTTRPKAIAYLFTALLS